MINYNIDEKYTVFSDGTSDGTQDKFLKDNIWYKLDRFGKEGIAEYTASLILKSSDFAEKDFVWYTPCTINHFPGCYSESFLKEGESFLSFYRLFRNTNGRELAQVCSQMDYDDAIEYVIRFVKETTNLDIREYLANNLLLDYLILNEDRHFNNLGVIYSESGFRTAPIFDNGKSFFIGNQKATKAATLKDGVKHVYAKAFSPSFEMNFKYLQKYISLQIPSNIVDILESDSLIDHTFIDVVKYQIERM